MQETILRIAQSCQRPSQRDHHYTGNTVMTSPEKLFQATGRVMATALILFLATQGTVKANDLPSINLGLTSYLDGVLPSGPGFYYQNYIEYYSASRFNDGLGHRLPLPKQSLDLVADINQITYYMPQEIGPGRLAFDLVVPAVVSASVRDGLGGAVLDSQTGIGDILFAPIYEFNPIAFSNGWQLSQSFEFDILAPTGKYDARAAVNPGKNAWALDPFWSVSTRIHYLYNFKNTDPPHSLGHDARTLQAGEAFHINLAISYAITPKFGIGLNGYYLTQLTNSRINNVGVPGRKERALGFGPGALWLVDRDTFVFLNAYFESNVRNRPKGNEFILRLVHHF
jgi:hypothetical protein